MPIPDFQTLMLPVLKLANTGDIALIDSISILSDEFNLTEEERKIMLPSGNMTTMRNRVAWAVVYLVKAGLIYRPKRAYFAITDRGEKILAEFPKKIDINFLMQFPEFVEFRNKKNEKVSVPEPNEDTATPEEKIDLAYTEIVEETKSELLSKVLGASPEFFEKLIIKLLVAMGYGGSSNVAGKHVGKSGDGGIDGIINEDELGLDIIYLQAKRYNPENKIGRPEIQKFAGSLIGMGANKGVFVTTSYFSSQAKEYAKNVPQRIILIDGDNLSSLMLQHNVGVRVQQTIKLKKIDEDFFLG